MSNVEVFELRLPHCKHLQLWNVEQVIVVSSGEHWSKNKPMQHNAIRWVHYVHISELRLPHCKHLQLCNVEQMSVVLRGGGGVNEGLGGKGITEDWWKTYHNCSSANNIIICFAWQRCRGRPPPRTHLQLLLQNHPPLVLPNTPILNKPHPLFQNNQTLLLLAQGSRRGWREYHHHANTCSFATDCRFDFSAKWGCSFWEGRSACFWKHLGLKQVIQGVGGNTKGVGQTMFHQNMEPDPPNIE